MHSRYRLLAMLGACLTWLGAVVVPPVWAGSTPFPAECPSTIVCKVEPAAYVANNGDVTDYGNYDRTNRPVDMPITQIVIHETEGDLPRALEIFKNPRSYVSAHYVIDRDGTVYQMVPIKDMAWHAGNWWVNMHSIGYEFIGHAATGGFTDKQYEAGAKLAQYHIGKTGMSCANFDCIVGHDEVPSVNVAGIAGAHTDPGPYWNKQKFFALIAGASFTGTSALSTGSNFNLGITIAPVWPLHKEEVTGCTNGVTPPSCTPPGKQPVSFVYLRSEPRPDAPLFTDPILGQGSKDINNNAARLLYGQTFAVASHKLERDGVWLKVAANGAYGWFFNPWSAPTAFPAIGGTYVTPKADDEVAVHGRPVPEVSAYDLEPPQTGSVLDDPTAAFWIPRMSPQAPLPYTLKPGQRYRVLDENPINDHFYAWASDSSFPYDHQVFKGETKFVMIQAGNRIGFVKRDAVTIG